MSLCNPLTPSALSPSLYSPATEGVIVCGPNTSAQMPPSNSSLMFPPVNFDDMFPQAPHSSPEPAPFSAAGDHTRGSILVPQPQRPNNVQAFIEATRNERADLYSGRLASTEYRSTRDLTRTENAGAKSGGDFHLPKISTSRSIAPQLPWRPLTQSAASCKAAQTAMTHVEPFDASEPFDPGFSLAGRATQTSGPPPDMPSASPRGSLFGSPSSVTYPDGSDYGAMPEEEGVAGFNRAGHDLSIPVALSHRQLAEQFCRMKSPPPPAYGWTHNTASVYSSMTLPASPRYPSRNSHCRSSPFAHSHPSQSFTNEETRPERRPIRSWGPEDELDFAATSPSAQLQQDIYIGDDFGDDLHPKGSQLDRRSRSTQNKPSIWDRFTTRVSRAHTYIFGKAPEYVYPYCS